MCKQYIPGSALALVIDLVQDGHEGCRSARLRDRSVSLCQHAGSPAHFREMDQVVMCLEEIFMIEA